MNLVLNRIDFSLPLISIVLDTGEGLENLILNNMPQDLLLESDIVAGIMGQDESGETTVALEPENAKGKNLVILEDDLTVAEVFKATVDDGTYHFASGEYKGTELLPVLGGLEFIQCATLNAFVPVNVKSVAVSYEPITLTPVSYIDSLAKSIFVVNGESYSDQTEENINGVCLSPLGANEADEESINAASIIILKDNHMFYQHFGWAKIHDGPVRFVAISLPEVANYTNSMIAVTSQQALLKEKFNVELFNVGESFTARKTEAGHTAIYTSICITYPHTVESHLVTVDAAGEAVDNPLELDEDTVALLATNVIELDPGALKMSLAMQDLDNR